MSLKGLSKGSRPTVDEFIASAPNRQMSAEPAEAKASKAKGYRPATLSLTEGWDGFLNELSCRTKRVRASRSDIVKVGMMLTSRLTPEQLDALIKESRNIPDEDLLEGDYIASSDALSRDL